MFAILFGLIIFGLFLVLVGSVIASICILVVRYRAVKKHKQSEALAAAAKKVSLV